MEDEVKKLLEVVNKLEPSLSDPVHSTELKLVSWLLLGCEVLQESKCLFLGFIRFLVDFEFLPANFEQQCIPSTCDPSVSGFPQCWLPRRLWCVGVSRGWILLFTCTCSDMKSSILDSLENNHVLLCSWEAMSKGSQLLQSHRRGPMCGPKLRYIRVSSFSIYYSCLRSPCEAMWMLFCFCFGLFFIFIFFVVLLLLYVAPSSYVCCSRYCQILFLYGWQSYWFKPCIIRPTYWCRIEFSKYCSRPESCHKNLHLPDTCLGFWCLRSPCEAVWMHFFFLVSILYLLMCDLASNIKSLFLWGW